MYISSIDISNYRSFRSQKIEFKNDINVIVGHNNAGKTNLLRALAVVLDNSSSKSLSIDDFNKNIPLDELKIAAPKVSIAVTFKKGNDHTPDDLAAIASCLTKLEEDYEAKLTYELFLPEKEQTNYLKEIDKVKDTTSKEDIWKIIESSFLRKYKYKIWAGKVENKEPVSSETISKFDFQFLDAIRDVERDMLSGKNNLLKDVFQFFMDYDLKKNINTLKPDEIEQKVQEIRTRESKFKASSEGVLAQLHERISEGKGEILGYANKTGADFNDSFPDFDGSISEKDMLFALQLIIKKKTGITVPATHNGLGYNNLIYMSLLLAKMQVNSDGSYMGSNAKIFPMLVIEEPESHLHPSMQQKLLKFLSDKNNKARQVFITTHSTHITSSCKLDNIINLYSDDEEYTVSYPSKALGNDDSKRYVQRFLDATKSDMLFAQKVIFVEGIAEQLLISTFAKYYDNEVKKTQPDLSKCLEDNHISVINVGGRYFEHFLKIFDTNDENAIPKKVVCLTDRDPVRKVESGNYEKCYPFELGTDNENYDYSNNSSQLIDKYKSHKNIRYFSQGEKSKTFEYELVLENPKLKLLLTDSISNKKELEELMDSIDELPIEEFIKLLNKGTVKKPHAENNRIIESIQSCSWDEYSKKKAILASRYLNSVGKGENALLLSDVLERNLEKLGTDEYQEFVVPQYIKDGIDFLCA
ncbi:MULTISPECIES: ATP-dependent nuclease [Vibrio harveyi group]|nr:MULTISPECIES: AAA family ATPase [Vibrio harveyi group]EJQ9993023.1 AAA family ATPase [Vibrio vulnificus]MCQ9060927.1 AAA family ATPase [Vibrio alginolyticus]MCY9819560.1 AAA family ATPase [Vibrio alginolyticus]HBC3415367.1 AAA family ATPase [Vibrio parahaemolyticus]HBC3600941.1 AAA family ATPase [Vibrio parahaemolyticus]